MRSGPPLLHAYLIGRIERGAKTAPKIWEIFHLVLCRFEEWNEVPLAYAAYILWVKGIDVSEIGVLFTYTLQIIQTYRYSTYKRLFTLCTSGGTLSYNLDILFCRNPK